MIRGAANADLLDLSCLRALIDVQGYAVLRDVYGRFPTPHIASFFGEAIAPWDDVLVQQLVPKATSTPNTYSGIFGLGRFPYHTDLAHWHVPPKYLLLRCIRGFTDVPTLLLDGRKLIDGVGVKAMSRALVSPRRPKAGEVRLLRLLERSPAGDIIRWDQVFLKPASRVGRDVFEEVQNLIDGADPTPIAMAGDGDVLIVDNWRMLHGRPAIAADRMTRRLERIYMRNLHEAHDPA